MGMDVWMKGRDTPVGVLTRSKDKSLSFVYADDVLPEHRISMSLPITSETCRSPRLTSTFPPPARAGATGSRTSATPIG